MIKNLIQPQSQNRSDSDLRGKTLDRIIFVTYLSFAYLRANEQ